MGSVSMLRRGTSGTFFPMNTPVKERLRRMGRKRILVLVPVALIAWLILFESFTEYVPPYEYGIKASRFGGGIVRETLIGGRWYFTAFGVTVHHFPRSVQTIEMTNSA